MQTKKIKLAEYELGTGKFKRFLTLGKDFGYLGDYIIIHHDSGLSWESESLEQAFDGESDFGDFRVSYYFDKYNKDEKDPLNRFDGRFNGRTYGEGRFVLVEDDEEDVYEGWYVLHNEETFRNQERFRKDKEESRYIALAKNCEYEREVIRKNSGECKIVGNLHENPELWEKVHEDDDGE